MAFWGFSTQGLGCPMPQEGHWGHLLPAEHCHIPANRRRRAHGCRTLGQEHSSTAGTATQAPCTARASEQNWQHVSKEGTWPLHVGGDTSEPKEVWQTHSPPMCQQCCWDPHQAAPCGPGTQQEH